MMFVQIVIVILTNTNTKTDDDLYQRRAPYIDS